MPTTASESVPRLKRLVPRLSGERIAVLGGLTRDRSLWSSVSRLTPGAAGKAVDCGKRGGCRGGAGNVAATLAALAARVEAFGEIGSDKPGGALRNAFR